MKTWILFLTFKNTVSYDLDASIKFICAMDVRTVCFAMPQNYCHYLFNKSLFASHCHTFAHTFISINTNRLAFSVCCGFKLTWSGLIIFILLFFFLTGPRSMIRIRLWISNIVQLKTAESVYFVRWWTLNMAPSIDIPWHCSDSGISNSIPMNLTMA